MATRYPYRVKAQSSTTGTGTYTLTEPGSVGYRTFTQAVADGDLANGDEVHYIVVDATVTNTPKLMEVGRGVWNNTTKTLTRAQVYQPNGTAVNWGAGTRDVLVVSNPGLFALLTNNLSDLPSASTARTNLGLGTAATQNVGTSASSVVQLDGSARLPAVDGRNLTNLATFPTGTKMLFAQAAAPTGWTQDTTWNDRVLRVVSGGTGGNTGGAWAISGLGGTAISVANLPTSPGSTVNWRSIQIQEADMSYSAGPVDVVELIRATFVGGDTQTSTVSNGSGTTHTHTGDGTWRPAYLDVIVASKNAP
jgi:hypothetical protein